MGHRTRGYEGSEGRIHRHSRGWVNVLCSATLGIPQVRPHPGTDGNPPFPWGPEQMPSIPAQYAGFLGFDGLDRHAAHRLDGGLMTFDMTVLPIAEVFQQPGEAAYRHANSQGAAFPNLGLCVSPGR